MAISDIRTAYLTPEAKQRLAALVAARECWETDEFPALSVVVALADWLDTGAISAPALDGAPDGAPALDGAP